MMTLENRFLDHLDKTLNSFPVPVHRLVLAFSGGLDSCVLLHLLANRRPEFDVLLWHVHHGLQECADDMAAFCQKQAGLYDFELKLSRLNLGRHLTNIEAEARKARYALFEQGLVEGDILLTAHHADDQAETFFLNLLRGSGVAGLRGIAENKLFGLGRLWRPLLKFERAKLVEYGQQQSLEWFEDPSNASHQFSRNYLRGRVLPEVKKRWPKYLTSIASTCTIQTETQLLLEQLASIDYSSCAVNPSDSTSNLSQPRLAALPASRQKNLIRFWLKTNNCTSLRARQLLALTSQLGAPAEAQPRIQTSQYDIRIHQQQLFIVPHQNTLQLDERYSFTDLEWLTVEAIGFNIKREDVFSRLGMVDQGQSLSIGFRIPDAQIKISKHRLKRLFQKYRVPPWLRAQTPLIFVDDDLKDLWI